MERHYKHLKAEERGMIFAENRRGSSLRQIGPLLGRHHGRGGVDQTACLAVGHDMVKAQLVAGDAGVDRTRPAIPRLGDEIRVGQKRARDVNHVGRAAARDVLGDLRHVDPVAGPG
jgi:hypothetical protein